LRKNSFKISSHDSILTKSIEETGLRAQEADSTAKGIEKTIQQDYSRIQAIEDEIETRISLLNRDLKIQQAHLLEKTKLQHLISDLSSRIERETVQDVSNDIVTR